MSKQDRLDDEHLQKVEIFFEVPPSARGTYTYEQEDGRVVHCDASGEWTLDENGEVDDIVFFASPRSLGYGRKEKAE
jgi:hypothetical protein